MQANLYVRIYGAKDEKYILRGLQAELKPGASQVLTWKVDDTGGAPIAEVGVEISSQHGASGVAYLDYLTWDGAPTVTFKRPEQRGVMWKRAWVNSLDHEERRDVGDWYPEAYRLIQNNGRGLLTQGTREWTDYKVSAPLTPHMCQATGVAARVQGLERYYALLLSHENKAQLVKVLEGETVLAEKAFNWQFGQAYELTLQVQGNRLVGSINGQQLFDYEDKDNPLTGGAIGLVCEEGRVACNSVTVQPIA